MTKAKEIVFDFSIPSECRKFLRGFRGLDGNPMTYVITECGKKIFVDEFDDEQAISFAIQIYNDFYLHGEGYYEEVLLN